MNIGHQLQPGESGIPAGWWLPQDTDTPFADIAEQWLEELSYDSRAVKARELAADLVKDSRSERNQ